MIESPAPYTRLHFDNGTMRVRYERFDYTPNDRGRLVDVPRHVNPHELPLVAVIGPGYPSPSEAPRPDTRVTEVSVRVPLACH